MALLVSYIAQALAASDREETHVLALMYAGFSLPLCMACLFAPVTYLLQSYRINYVTIIGFDHTQCLHPFEFGIIAGECNGEREIYLILKSQNALSQVVGIWMIGH